jgi:hypothetical protein
MSDEQNDPKCPSCGEPVPLAVDDPDRVERGPNDTVVMNLPIGRQCENPDCPSHDGDLAPVADGQEWLNTPGAEGGANGGA